MNKFLLMTAALFVAGTSAAGAWDLKDALKGLGGSGDDSKSSAVEALTGALGNVLSTSKLDVKQLEGNWKYSGPAVSFASDNLLKKAGGAAASTVITSKLESIYNKTGINGLTLDITEAGEFQMKIKNITLKGTIAPLEKEGTQANFEFNFSAGKIKLGKMNAYVEKSINGTMKLTFDISKLIPLLEKVAGVTKIGSLQTLTSALSSYDGLCAGFELKK